MIPSEVRTGALRGARYHYGVFHSVLWPEVSNPSWFSFEVAETDIREKWWAPEADEHVVDAGVAFGSYSLPALAAGATVWSFEPDPVMAEFFEVNLKLNDFGERSRLFLHGLGAAPGMFPYPPPGHPAGSHTVEIPVEPLDDVAEREGLSHLEWMKVDTEGQEHLVLRGARRTLRKHHPRLLLEIHKFLDRPGEPTHEALIQHELEGLGYGAPEVLRGSPVDYYFLRTP